MNETELLRCTGQRIVYGQRANYTIACPIARKCLRYRQEPQPWHPRPTILCQGDVDSFIDYGLWLSASAQ